MADPAPRQPSRDLRAFRFRLRHDHLLRQRLRRAKQEATVALAQELGYAISVNDLQRKPRSRNPDPA